MKSWRNYDSWAGGDLLSSEGSVISGCSAEDAEIDGVKSQLDCTV